MKNNVYYHCHYNNIITNLIFFLQQLINYNKINFKKLQKIKFSIIINVKILKTTDNDLTKIFHNKSLLNEKNVKLKKKNIKMNYLK